MRISSRLAPNGLEILARYCARTGRWMVIYRGCAVAR